MRRGSKVIAASIVATTTAANASAAGPGRIVATAFNCYLLGLGHDKLAVFVALNLGIAIAALFRFWSYRQFVWGAVPASGPSCLSSN